MPEETNPTPATPTSGNGETAPAAAASTEAAPAAAATEPKPSAAHKLVAAAQPRVRQAVAAAQPKVKQAIEFTKTHPLGAVATVAAAAALVEVEFAVGILTGLGATALLTSESGPQAREKVVARGKLAFARARGALTKRTKPTTAPATPTTEAPPPAA